MKTKTISSTILIVLIASLFFSSCQKILEFDGEITEPMFVMNSLLVPDSLVRVHLSESHFFLNEADSFNVVENADVYIYRNNIQIEKLNYITNGYYYTTSFTPAIGDDIKITASTGKFGEIEANTQIVEAIPLTSVEVSNFRKETFPQISYGYHNGYSYQDTTGYQTNLNCDINIRFTDPPETENYYRLMVLRNYYYDNGAYNKYPVYFDINDLLAGGTNVIEDFLDFSGYADSYNEFADDIYNGKEISLKLSTSYWSGFEESEGYTSPGGGYQPPYEEGEEPIESKLIRIELEIELQSLSRDYYYYLKTRYMSEDSDIMGGLFSEPVQVYNNVKNGIGIVGSYSSSIYTSDLPKEIEN